MIAVWQTGLARPLIEAFYPPPPQPRVIPGVLPQRQAQANQPNQPAQANAPNAPVNNPVDPIDPARTAQIIIERHEGTSRRIFRAFENGVGLFIASLVPGLHERHVEAAERREMELRRAREGAQAGTGQEGQNPGEDQAQPTPAPEFQSAEQPQQPQEPAPMGHPEQPQDQDNLRRRNLRARVDDAEDEARNAGIAGPVGVGAGFTF